MSWVIILWTATSFQPISNNVNDYDANVAINLALSLLFLKAFVISHHFLIQGCCSEFPWYRDQYLRARRSGDPPPPGSKTSATIKHKQGGATLLSPDQLSGYLLHLSYTMMQSSNVLKDPPRHLTSAPTAHTTTIRPQGRLFKSGSW